MLNNFVLFSTITFQWNFIIVLGWCIWLHRVIARSSHRQSVTTVKSHRTFGTVTWNSSATYTRTPAVFVWSEWPPTTLTPHLQAPETFVAVWPIPVTGVSSSLFENAVFTFFRKIKNAFPLFQKDVKTRRKHNQNCQMITLLTLTVTVSVFTLSSLRISLSNRQFTLCVHTPICKKCLPLLYGLSNLILKEQKLVGCFLILY